MITTLSLDPEQYHLLEIVVGERVSPLPVVVALRNAGATATATDTTIYERRAGGTLRDFRSTQHDYASWCKGAYHIAKRRADRARRRRRELIVTNPMIKRGCRWDRRWLLVISAFGDAKGTWRHIMLEWMFCASEDQPWIDCEGMRERWLSHSLNAQTVGKTLDVRIGNVVERSVVGVRSHCRRGGGEEMTRMRHIYMFENISKPRGGKVLHNHSTFRQPTICIGNDHRRM